MLKQAHYTYAPEMRPRYKRDEHAVAETFGARATAFDLFRALEPTLASPRLVSTCFGALDRLLLTMPSYVFSYPAYAGVYEDLFTKLPGNATFVILVHASARQNLNQMLTRVGVGARVTVIEAPEFLRFSVWAEDGYAVSQEAGTGPSYFVEPASFARLEDAMIADVVAAQTDLELYHASLYFQGGNILIGDDFWLLGADYPTRSLRLGLFAPAAGETPAAAITRAYGSALDAARRLLLVGSTLPVPSQAERQFTLNGETWTEELYAGNAPGTVQPMFHIDMFVTLAGRDAQGRPIALVGDPRLASQVLGEALQPHAMAPIYDDIAKKLQQQGFAVVRNPLPLVYQDDPREKKRYWYFATANNALVEANGGSKSVWLPTYGHGSWPELQATDQENRRIWESLGFQVGMLADFHPFAFNLGAVHCIKKYLTRA